MSRRNGEGVERQLNPPKTYDNPQPNFDSGDAFGKALATMQARAELCGCTVYELGDGGFLVGRWGYGKSVPCLRAVGDLLRQIGGH